jgi:hypothetical protein
MKFVLSAILFPLFIIRNASEHAGVKPLNDMLARLPQVPAHHLLGFILVLLKHGIDDFEMGFGGSLLNSGRTFGDIGR